MALAEARRALSSGLGELQLAVERALPLPAASLDPLDQRALLSALKAAGLRTLGQRQRALHAISQLSREQRMALGGEQREEDCGVGEPSDFWTSISEEASASVAIGCLAEVACEGVSRGEEWIASGRGGGIAGTAVREGKGGGCCGGDRLRRGEARSPLPSRTASLHMDAQRFLEEQRIWEREKERTRPSDPYHSPRQAEGEAHVAAEASEWHVVPAGEVRKGVAAFFFAG